MRVNALSGWAKRNFKVSRLILTAVAAFALALQPFAGIQQASAASTDVVINEFSSNTSPDWVELYNTGAGAIDLTDWTLRDSTATNKVDLSGVLLPGDWVTFDFSNKLNNTGDTVRLFDDTDALIDDVTYGSGEEVEAPGPTESAARIKDGTGFWSIWTPTPDAENTPADIAPHLFETNDDAEYKGVISVFGVGFLGTVEEVRAELERADGSVITKYATQEQKDILSNQVIGLKITTRFVIQEGTFGEADDTHWTSDPDNPTWDDSTKPTKVTVYVTDEDGTISATNTVLDETEGSYESLLPPVPPETIVVTDEDPKGWNDRQGEVGGTTAGGNVSFVQDEDAPLGEGALQLKTNGSVDAKAQFLLPEDVLLQDVTALSYDSKQIAASHEGGNAGFALVLDLDGDTLYDTDLVFEPYWQDSLADADPVVPNTWQSWDVDAGQFWSTQTVDGLVNTGEVPTFYTLADVLALHPDANVIGIAVNVGENNPDHTVNVDKVVFNNTTYDFEPTETDDTGEDEEEPTGGRGGGFEEFDGSNTPELASASDGLPVTHNLPTVPGEGETNGEEGDVLADRTDENGEEQQDQQQEEQPADDCAAFFGTCWYWWVVGIVTVGGAGYILLRGRQIED